MTTISAEAILVSRNMADPNPDRKLATLLLRYPRWIHAELMTHRVFSRNAASSRAIPVSKMIEGILADPAVPLFWGKNQKGMQAGAEHNGLISIDYSGDGDPREHVVHYTNEKAWRLAMEDTVEWARRFADAGYHKQIVNRLLEPFMHITVVVSATEWSNFFALRDHPDAEPHIRLLAQRMKAALYEAEIQFLQPGGWHLPFVPFGWGSAGKSWHPNYEVSVQDAIKLSVARCASTSYKTVDGFDMTPERAIELHDKLVSSAPLHASPAEHQGQADEWAAGNRGPYGDIKMGWERPQEHGNFTGFRQYRKMLPGESQ